MCDVPHLRDRLVLFSNRTPPSPHYARWKAGGGPGRFPGRESAGEPAPVVRFRAGNEPAPGQDERTPPVKRANSVPRP